MVAGRRQKEQRVSTEPRDALACAAEAVGRKWVDVSVHPRLFLPPRYQRQASVSAAAAAAAYLVSVFMIASNA